MSGRAEPVWVAELDLDGPAPQMPEPGRYGHAALSVRLHGTLVGVVQIELGPDGRDVEDLRSRAAEALRDRIDEHLCHDGPHADDAVPPCVMRHREFLARAPEATVIVASRDGEETLAGCLDSLLRLDYPRFGVVVVDSASRSDRVRSIVRARAGGHVPVEYVREARPGLAVAHNRGLAIAHGSLAAFTDDDVIVDRAWLAQLAKAFEAAPDVGCATGLILPAELESRAQLWLDEYWGFGKGLERRVYDRRRLPGRPLHPYTAGTFGSGASMAFRTDVLRDLGGFDPALGAGTLARGGDDLAAFFDVIAAGRSIVYEPTAVVYHRHRRDYASLRAQAYGYGVGLSAYLAKTVADDPRRVADILRRAPRALSYVLDPRSTKNARRPAGFPAELTRAERRGMLVGALAYGRSRRRMAAGAG